MFKHTIRGCRSKGFYPYATAPFIFKAYSYYSAGGASVGGASVGGASVGGVSVVGGGVVPPPVGVKVAEIVASS